MYAVSNLAICEKLHIRIDIMNWRIWKSDKMILKVNLVTLDKESGGSHYALYLDFKSAFGSVNINLLLKKLAFCNVPNALYNIIESLLKRRSFYTVFGNSNSTTLPVISGLPQGAILSLFCFLFT